jgi:hypothetical protein
MTQHNNSEELNPQQLPCLTGKYHNLSSFNVKVSILRYSVTVLATSDTS